MTDPRDDIDHWPAALEASIARTGDVLRRVTVVRETRSTQDAARTAGARAGAVLVAGRQTAGRGRLGRPWADTGADGVAMTIVLPAAPPERLAVASAVAVVSAVERAGAAGAGIKWPNDVVIGGAGGRKIAGILVEQSEGVARVGIGVNVGQRGWPGDLAGRAVSLREIGSPASRLDVMCDLVTATAGVTGRSDDELTADFARRDVLAGSRGRFRSGDREYEGRIVRVHPMRGLVLALDGGAEVWLPAARTTVLSAGG